MPRYIDDSARRGREAGRATFTAFGLAAEAEPIAPGLYVVATPIGNLADITLRALNVLAASDAVLAEDTRVTRTLLAHYGITTPLLAYHEHSAEEVRERVIERLRQGEALALVSDAGTPLVSDPGYRLVEAALEAGAAVIPVPGPSAILAALVASGLPSDRFTFEGFLPPRGAARRARLAEIAGLPGTLILFEAPHRLPEMLADAAAMLGDRPAVVAREMTKLFETVRRGRLPALAAAFAEEGPPRGEVVVLVGQGSGPAPEAVAADLDARLAAELARRSLKEAVALVAAETGRPRREVYARALALGRPEDAER